MAIRKVEHEGAWWAQRGDGSWVRWDAARNDWELRSEPASGAPVEAPVLDFPVSTGTSGWSFPMGPVLGFVGFYLLMLLGTFLAILVAACGLAVLNLIFLFLGSPIDISEFIKDATIFAAVYLGAVRIAMVIVARSPVMKGWGLLGWLGAFGVLVLGSTAAAHASGVRLPEGVQAQLNAMALVGLATMGLMAGLRRLIERLTTRPRRQLPWSMTFLAKGRPYQSQDRVAAMSDVAHAATPPP